MTPPRAVRAEGLTKRYGALDPTGAGKTIFLRMLFGLIRPDAGNLEGFGRTWARDGTAALRAWPVSSRAHVSTAT